MLNSARSEANCWPLVCENFSISASTVSFFFSSPDAVDGYFMLYEQDGVACAFLFEATAQTLKICRFYNPSATVVTKVRY